MSEDEKKDVVKKDPTPPARISGEGGQAEGFDDVDREDYKMPRLAVLQGLSEIVTSGDGKMGDIANSITKEVYGNEVEIIPLFLFKTRAQFEIGRGLVMLSLDNKTVTFGTGEFAAFAGQAVEDVPGVEWTDDGPPKFGLVYNFPCLLAGERMNEFPACMSLMRTATKTAKDFISMSRFSGEDMRARVYTLKTVIEKNDKGTFAVPKITFKRRCTDEEYAVASKWFGELYKKKSNISVDLNEEPLADPKTGTDKEPDEFEE